MENFSSRTEDYGNITPEDMKELRTICLKNKRDLKFQGSDNLGVFSRPQIIFKKCVESETENDVKCKTD